MKFTFKWLYKWSWNPKKINVPKNINEEDFFKNHES